MKKFITPILVIIGFFALMYAALASTDRTTTIALVGAGYSVLLVAIYLLILAIKNPNFSIWWSLPDDATRAEILATYISNFLVCGAICGSAFQLPKEHLSEIPIVYFATVPIVVAVIACVVRRIIVKHNKYLKSASNLNDNLNCSKELEHYAS